MRTVVRSIRFNHEPTLEEWEELAGLCLEEAHVDLSRLFADLVSRFIGSDSRRVLALAEFLECSEEKVRSWAEERDRPDRLGTMTAVKRFIREWRDA